jgi:Rv0078B-related antitoxin
MTPQAALDAQIEKYRAMTGEERLKLALDLHELSCEIARAGIRYQHPQASGDEVERLLQARIALAQSL